MGRLRDQDTLVAAALFVLVSSIYFATLSGVTSSNDGSHYALVRAIVDQRSFEISPYLSFTEFQDYAMRGDLRFSDRPPGTGLVTAPLYALSYIAPQPLVPVPSKHDPENPRLLYAVMSASLSASAAVVLVYLTLRHHLERSTTAALLTCLSLALGTISWKYGSVLFSHALGALIVTLAVYLVFSLQAQPDPHWLLALFLGFVLGFAPLVEYTNVPFSAVVGLSILPRFRQVDSASGPTIWSKGLAALGIGGLMPILFLLIYNTVNFGGPFELSTFNVDTELWPQNEGMAADFATPLRVGLPALLYYGAKNQGLFLLSPVALLSVLGWPAFYRFSRLRSLLLLGLFVLMLLIFARSTTFNPATNDGRYLAPFLSLWFVPLAFWLDEVYLPARSELSRLVLSLLLFGLFFLSVRNQLFHIALSWNYDLDLSRLERLAIPPQNISYFLSTVFPNIGNLPILWAGELLVIGGYALVTRWRQRQAKKSLMEPVGTLSD